MAQHLSYEESVRGVWKGLGLLAAVTVIEVLLSLLKAAEFAESIRILIYVASLLIIALSLYKAYFIIYEFMHMGYEVKGLAMSVLLPTFLLLWALIAFFNEGDAWRKEREKIQYKNELAVPAGDEVGLNDTVADPFAG
ncbi:cytochrome C oxidase subunit IV family protein [Lewinella sp. JB7]|uniref:cytochrome C oxidase subunit IV family protein n=1 Tax=Lewinella sp. JB7 TaxID=2962887 RepID=UPI0020C9F92F|nr:cytochrome C oxidase subunit IV family protein [Lewinella sp. JB7]MCP9235466.1 cytochrome C oxidase subunit IV family protein [Lewinella sp. JB7]